MSLEDDHKAVAAQLNGTVGQLQTLLKDCVERIAVQFNTQQTDWYFETIASLNAALLVEYTNLETANLRKDAPPDFSNVYEIAWRCRNLLELSIWLEYCLSNQSDARQFYEDSKRDTLDWISAFQGLTQLGAKHQPSLQSMIDQLDKDKQQYKAAALSDGFSNLDGSFTRIEHAAQTLSADYREAFLRLNKIFSKLAHPTAFTILDPVEEKMIPSLKLFMRGLALALALEAVKKLHKYLLELNPSQPATS